jgi:hypothetical protein
MADFSYTDLLPTGPDGTEYRLLTNDGISVQRALGRDFLQVEPEVLTESQGTMAANCHPSSVTAPVWWSISPSRIGCPS